MGLIANLFKALMLTVGLGIGYVAYVLFSPATPQNIMTRATHACYAGIVTAQVKMGSRASTPSKGFSTPCPCMAENLIKSHGLEGAVIWAEIFRMMLISSARFSSFPNIPNIATIDGMESMSTKRLKDDVARMANACTN